MMDRATVLLAQGPALHGWLYSTIDPPNWLRGVLYIITWAAMLGAVYIFYIRAPRRDKAKRWSTQDIFVVAILAVILLAWDSFIRQQVVLPILSSIPVFGPIQAWFQLGDLPYMFLVMVAAVTIRKPGAVTALIFIKRVIGEIMFSTKGINIAFWPDALNEGVFIDLFIMWRGDKFVRDAKFLFVDGFIIGLLRSIPNAIIGEVVLNPFLYGELRTWAFMIWGNFDIHGGILGNGIGNALEAAVSTPLALRVSRSVGMLTPYKPAADSSSDNGSSAVETSEHGASRRRALRLVTLTGVGFSVFLLIDGIVLMLSNGLQSHAKPLFGWLGGSFANNHSFGTALIAIGMLLLIVLAVGWFANRRHAHAAHQAPSHAAEAVGADRKPGKVVNP